MKGHQPLWMRIQIASWAISFSNIWHRCFFFIQGVRPLFPAWQIVGLLGLIIAGSYNDGYLLEEGNSHADSPLAQGCGGIKSSMVPVVLQNPGSQNIQRPNLLSAQVTGAAALAVSGEVSIHAYCHSAEQFVQKSYKK